MGYREGVLLVWQVGKHTGRYKERLVRLEPSGIRGGNLHFYASRDSDTIHHSSYPLPSEILLRVPQNILRIYSV